MVRAMLSESLKAVISQTLLKKNGGGRVAAHEIMIGTPAIREPHSREPDRPDVLRDPDRAAARNANPRSGPLRRSFAAGVVSREASVAGRGEQGRRLNRIQADRDSIEHRGGPTLAPGGRFRSARVRVAPEPARMDPMTDL